MKTIDLDPSTVAILAGVALLGVLLWRASSAVGDSLTAVPEAVKDSYGFLKENGGVAVVAGDVLGVPRTNQSQCERDKAAGDTWAASFSCPAADWLRYVIN